MPFDVLEKYLERLHQSAPAGTRVWLDADGRAQGRYFNSTMSSAFQAIRALGSGRVFGYEGFARSDAESDRGLCVWRMLDRAATDDESIELDRLCRVLHAINFYRQPEASGADLFVSVHARLLAAVDGNHGVAFRRILDVLALPHERIVLQLPAVTHRQNWLLNYVSENYRRNGFRFAVNAGSLREALALLDHVRPDVVKVEASESAHERAALTLLQEAARRGIRVIFKRLENAPTLDALARLQERGGQPVYAQGFLLDLPQASLGMAAARRSAA